MDWKKKQDGMYVVDREDHITDIGSFVDADGEIYHVQNVGRIIQHCNELQKDSGWSKDRTLKRAASIPLVEFLKHPALAELDTNEAVEKYIAKYLPQYSNVHETRGALCPNIIVK